MTKEELEKLAKELSHKFSCSCGCGRFDELISFEELARHVAKMVISAKIEECEYSPYEYDRNRDERLEELRNELKTLEQL